MYPSGLHYFPVAWPVLLVLLALLGLVFGVVAVRVWSLAAESLGLSLRSILVLLLASLLGSYINIPIAYLPQREIPSAATVTYFGIRYVIPVVREWPATILAINVGGAIIPVLLSLYLVNRNRLYGVSAVAIVIVAAVCHSLAHPVPGFGIALPIFDPPVISGLVGAILARKHAGALAYIAGSLGTLIGADILNLGKLQGLGAPIASIGGAGTFDGIFVTGLLAVLYAGLVNPRRLHRPPR